MDENLIATLTNFWPLIAAGVTAAIAVAYKIVKRTKSKNDDKIVAGIRDGWAALKDLIGAFLRQQNKKKK